VQLGVQQVQVVLGVQAVGSKVKLSSPQLFVRGDLGPPSERGQQLWDHPIPAVGPLSRQPLVALMDWREALPGRAHEAEQLASELFLLEPLRRPLAAQ
jgi:hypothetical protein